MNNEKECDFVVKRGKQVIAIQAAFNVDITNRNREVEGIRFVMEKFKIPTGFIVTFNQAESITSQIQMVPFYRLFFDRGHFLSDRP